MCLAGQIIILTLGQILTELIRDLVLLLWEPDRRKTEKEKAERLLRDV